MAFQYTPDDEMLIHPNTVRLLCQNIQSHESGLPEWVKNSADEYARRGPPPEHRVVVLLFANARGGRPAAMACLDFGGMTSAVIERYFRSWGNPDAAHQGGRHTGLEGGHGNGGKCYMAQMFDDYAVLWTCLGGIGCRYGIQGASMQFGYIPDPSRGRDYAVPDATAELAEALKMVGLRPEALPTTAIDAFGASQGFTLVAGVRPTGYSRRVPVDMLLDTIEEHPQMVNVLTFCSVYVVSDGVTLRGGAPLQLPTIEPILGAEQPRVIQIPPRLRDPATNEKVATTGPDGATTGTLSLHTSRVGMQYSQKKKVRHMVVFRDGRDFLGYVPVPELGVQSVYRNKIYGECDLPCLARIKQNDRSRLAESPLKRAVERFIAYHIECYAREFERRDQSQYGAEQKQAIVDLSDALDRWKNRLLSDVMQGLGGGEGQGEETYGAGALPVGKPRRVVASVTSPTMGVGVPTRPQLRFFDAQGRQIRPVPVRWDSEEPGVAMVDDETGVLTSYSCGTTAIWAETLNGRVRSNILPITVVRIREITVSPLEIEVPAGSRLRIEAVCRLATGEEIRDVGLLWFETNPQVARVSAGGLVYAFAEGETEVTAGDDYAMAATPATVRVTAAEKGSGGDDAGKGYPRLLVAGEGHHVDPATGDYKHLSPDDPPLFQDAVDANRNIWWINNSAPMARVYLNQDRFGYNSREFRAYYLERLVEAVVQMQLKLQMQRGDIDENMTPYQWFLESGYRAAAVQAVMASELSSFLEEGTLPEV